MTLAALTTDLTAAHALVRAAEREWDAACDAMVEGMHDAPAAQDAALRRCERARADVECARAVLERCEREVGRVWRVANEQEEAR